MWLNKDKANQLGSDVDFAAFFRDPKFINEKMKGMIKMPNPHLKKITLFIVMLSLISCAAMPPKAPDFQAKGDYSDLKEYMTWFIQKEMKDNDIVGLSIALVDDQKILWQQGFGYADRENKIDATPETLYRAGSISKVFNGMAAMKLVEAGKMDIDRPLSTYLPEFKIKSRFGNTDGITPRTIMTHHSGLPYLGFYTH
jgi:CubicO group peptidase (beta-lactamase class C family)